MNTQLSSDDLVSSALIASQLRTLQSIFIENLRLLPLKVAKRSSNEPNFPKTKFILSSLLKVGVKIMRPPQEIRGSGHWRSKRNFVLKSPTAQCCRMQTRSPAFYLIHTSGEITDQSLWRSRDLIGGMSACAKFHQGSWLPLLRGPVWR